MFALNTNGTGFRTLQSFTGLDSDGAYPGELTLSGNTLYGTAFGTVFGLSFTPQLTIIPSGPNIVLSWPANYAGFDYTGFTLQSTTNLGSSAIWSTNSPASVVINSQRTVTAPISGTQQFYRLSQ